jgi:hypothetical protein
MNERTEMATPAAWPGLRPRGKHGTVKPHRARNGDTRRSGAPTLNGDSRWHGALADEAFEVVAQAGHAYPERMHATGVGSKRAAYRGARASGRPAALALASALALTGCSGDKDRTQPVALRSVAAHELHSPEEFQGISAREERSRALFLEATRVMFHPRCRNCHPDGDSPLQGDEGRAHDPPIVRGPADHGAPGLECTSCHQDRNLELARVPGAPKWALAPRAMAWVGRSARALCEQLKDPERNGHKDLAHIVEHSAHDELVAWGWRPGHGRAPAPGTQAEFGALMAAWAESGAECPREESKP